MRTRVTPFFSALVQASSLGSMPPLTVGVGDHLPDGVDFQPPHHRTVSVFHAIDIGEINERMCAARDGAGRGHSVGIHVVVLPVIAERQA